MNTELSRIMQTGKENYISSAEIMALTGIHTEREVRKLISAERKSGAVILSNENGYFLPGNAEEVEQFIRTNEKKAKSLLKVLKSARDYLKNMESENNQIVMNEFEQNQYMEGGETA